MYLINKLFNQGLSAYSYTLSQPFRGLEVNIVVEDSKILGFELDRSR
jgi:hypothetical protein